MKWKVVFLFCFLFYFATQQSFAQTTQAPDEGESSSTIKSIPEVTSTPSAAVPTITKLTLDSSVIATDGPAICVAKKNRFVRGKVRYGVLYKQMHAQRSMVSREVGRYGTETDPYMNVAMRRCTSQQRGTSSYGPLTAMINIPNPAAKERQRVITQYKLLDALLAEWIIRWNTNDISYHLPDPAVWNPEIQALVRWNFGQDLDSSNITAKDNQAQSMVYFPPLNEVFCQA